MENLTIDNTTVEQRQVLNLFTEVIKVYKNKLENFHVNLMNHQSILDDNLVEALQNLEDAVENLEYILKDEDLAPVQGGQEIIDLLRSLDEISAGCFPK